MNGVNKVIIIGNLGQDPEVRYMPNGNAVTNVSIATNESWTDKTTNQKQERVEFHRVVFFGKLAEIAGQYLRKGSKVYVEGKLRTRKWQGQDGQDRYTTEIVVDIGGTMQMLDSKNESAVNQGQQVARQQSAPQPQQQAPRQAAPQQAAPAQQPYGNGVQQTPPASINDDFEDLPF